MWRPTIRVQDEKLELLVKERLEKEGRTIQEVVIEFLTSYANGETSQPQEQVQHSSAPKSVKLVDGYPNLGDLPDYLKKPSEFKYYLDYVDYLEREGFILD